MALSVDVMHGHGTSYEMCRQATTVIIVNIVVKIVLSVINNQQQEVLQFQK